MSPGNLLEMSVLGPDFRPTESETLEVGPGQSVFFKRFYLCIFREREREG